MHATTTLRRWQVAGLTVLAAVAGCSSDGDDAVSGGALGTEITGYLLAAPGALVQMCEQLDDSPPSGCAGQATTVNGLDPDDVAPGLLQAAGDVRWSPTSIILYADTDGGEATVPVAVTGAAITGRALAGPTCPGDTSPTNPACAPVAVAGAPITVVDAGGSVVVDTVTDATGRFAVAVDPGTYTVQAAAVEGLLGGAPPSRRVTVTTLPVEVNVAYDTGIR